MVGLGKCGVVGVGGIFWAELIDDGNGLVQDVPWADGFCCHE